MGVEVDEVDNLPFLVNRVVIATRLLPKPKELLFGGGGKAVLRAEGRRHEVPRVVPGVQGLGVEILRGKQSLRVICFVESVKVEMVLKHLRENVAIAQSRVPADGNVDVVSQSCVSTWAFERWIDESRELCAGGVAV